VLPQDGREELIGVYLNVRTCTNVLLTSTRDAKLRSKELLQPMLPVDPSRFRKSSFAPRLGFKLKAFPLCQHIFMKMLYNWRANVTSCDARPAFKMSAMTVSGEQQILFVVLALQAAFHILPPQRYRL
jgi:hypothetical protein